MSHGASGRVVWPALRLGMGGRLKGTDCQVTPPSLSSSPSSAVLFQSPAEEQSKEGATGTREGRRGCVAAELCFGTSGTVETLIPFQINSPYFPSTPPTQPVSQKPRSGVEFLSIFGGANCGGASHPELQTSQHKTEAGAPGAPD